MLQKEQLFNDQDDAVEHAPEDEVPRSTMPETCQQPDGHDVEDLPFQTLPVAAQGDVYVITEPEGQGHMPSSPEFGDAFCNIGVIEVFKKVEAEHLSHADRHIRVAGEIEVDLEGIADDACPGTDHAHPAVPQSTDCFKDCTGAVGKKHLLGKTRHEADHAFIEAVNGMIPVFQLLCDITVADNRAGDQLREHGDIGAEADGTSLRVGVMAEDIDRIGHCLECIEADADRQADVQGMDEVNPQGIQVCGKEVEVLEEAKQGKVEDDTQCQPLFCGCNIIVAVFCHLCPEEPVGKD